MDQATLVILTPGFPASEEDSTCLPLQQSFVKILKETHPQLKLIILSFQFPFQQGAYEWREIQVISFEGKNKGGLSRLLLWRKVNKKLAQLKKENNIIGVLSFWCGECALIGKRFADKYGIKHFCWILGQDAKKDNIYVSRIKPVAGELLALSDFVQQEFEKNHGIRPAFIIPPGLDTRQFDNINHSKDIDILGAGSLIALKQYDIFLEIVHAIKMDLPGIKVVLCGVGPEKENLERQVSKLKLQDTVTMTGELTHGELLKFMQRSKVFLHPSAYEGFGVVCLEALYAGSEVISFCQPMQREIKNWYIVDSKEMMAEKARMLLESFTGNDPVLIYSIEETVNKVIVLFGA